MKSFYQNDGITIYCGDMREVVPQLGEKVDYVVTDPPYCLSSYSLQDRCDEILRLFQDVVFPNFSNGNTPLSKYSELTRILIQGSDLRWFKEISVKESRVSMPESSVDFNNKIVVGEIEITASTESPGFWVTDSKLVDELDSKSSEFLGDYVFDFGNTVNSSISDVSRSDFGQLAFGLFCVPISSISAPLSPNFSGDLAFNFNRTGILDLIRFGDNSFRESKRPPFILASWGTEDRLMLGFDLRGGSGKLLSAEGTDEFDTFGKFLSPKLIRTFSGASSLSSMLEPLRIGLIVHSTNGADSKHCYLQIWVPKGFSSNIQKLDRKVKGFMGKEWDNEISFQQKTWKVLFEACKPGSPLMAFGGCRTQHRMVCAIEDAGWEICNQIYWLFGSGFPKSHDISKAMDKAAGADREVVGFDEHKAERFRRGLETHNEGWDRPWMHKADAVERVGNITVPTTDAAKLWDGYGAGLQNLKPAAEPICYAQRPREGTYTENALKHGVAGLNVDAGRIAGQKWTDSSIRKVYSDPNRLNWSVTTQEKRNETQREMSSLGRWPANVILTHDPRCEKIGMKKVKGTKHSGKAGTGKKSMFGMEMTGETQCYASPDGTETVEEWRCVEGCPVLEMDRQSGKSGGSGGVFKGHNAVPISAIGKKGNLPEGYTDRGGASRFFKQCQYGEEAWICHEDCALRRLDEQSGDILAGYRKNPSTNKTTWFGAKDGEHIEGERGYKDTGGASRFFYCAKASRSERGEGNTHPTVKPLKLLQYLIGLLCPPSPDAVCLDPFMGSGSTLVAAKRMGKRAIGVEIDEAACEIAVQRLQETESDRQMRMF